ncbi:hypothetical protein ACFLQ7_00610, partial [Actinomycetota bacterium]
IAIETEAEYRRLLMQLSLASNRFPPAMQDATAVVIANYQGRADAFKGIIEAEVAQDNNAWVAAAEKYQSYSSPDVALATLRQAFSTPEIEEILIAQGSSLDELLQALAAAAGVG